MKSFHNVVYGKMWIKLESFLRVVGEGAFELSADGDGNFILPATGVAGATKRFFQGSLSEGIWERITFYDAVAEMDSVRIEERSGIRINPATLTAEDGSLRKLLYIGQGMLTELRVEAFLNNESECEEFRRLFYTMCDAIADGEISFGAGKTKGAGQFEVIGTSYRQLNLLEEHDFKEYLRGTKCIFDELRSEPYDNRHKCQALEVASTEMRLVLRAEIPNGLIVKGGKERLTTEQEADAKQLDAVNVSKSVDEKYTYYIPGTSIKGCVRAYAEKIARFNGISEDVLVTLFGGEKEGVKYRSHLRTQDTLLPSSDIATTVHNRIAIDRWLGGTMPGAKMDEEIIYTKKDRTIVLSMATYSKEDGDRKLLNALIFLTLRDMGLGLVPIGSGSGIGFGRLQGVTLDIAGQTLPYTEKGLDFSQNESLKEEVQSWLDVLKGGCAYAD